MSKCLGVLFAALLLMPQASAEIFKCAGKDGLDRYQNFPCQFDTMGWQSQGAEGVKPSSPGDSNPRTQTKSTRTEGAASKSLVATEPRLGMTAEEVKAVWGEASDSYYDELVDGRVEIWSYGPSRSVTFNVKGRVSAIQW